MTITVPTYYPPFRSHQMTDKHIIDFSSILSKVHEFVLIMLL